MDYFASKKNRRRLKQVDWNADLPQSTTEKIRALRALATKRKADRLNGHYTLSDFHDGAYDRHEYVSPWSISAHNIDARLMVILQDWSSEDKLSRPLDTDAAAIGYTPSLATNKKLLELIRKHFGLDVHEIYVTNLFVFIKRGGISANVPMADAVYSARTYTIPQIEIVKPAVAVCAGSLTFNALRRAIGLRKVGIKDAPFHPLRLGTTTVYGVPHTGGLGTANAGGNARVDEIWRMISQRHFDI